jgi:hypothetical protein
VHITRNELLSLIREAILKESKDSVPKDLLSIAKSEFPDITDSDLKLLGGDPVCYEYATGDEKASWCKDKLSGQWSKK